MKKKSVTVIMPSTTYWKDHPYVQNMQNIVTGYFAVYEMVFLWLYLRLDAKGYMIPNVGIKKSRIRPHKSIGTPFRHYLNKKYPTDDLAVINIPFYDSDGEVPNFDNDYSQYPIKYLPDFHTFFFQTWLPHNGREFFWFRDPRVIPYLEHLIITQDQVFQKVSDRSGAEHGTFTVEPAESIKQVQSNPSQKQGMEEFRRKKYGY